MSDDCVSMFTSLVRARGLPSPVDAPRACDVVILAFQKKDKINFKSASIKQYNISSAELLNRISNNICRIDWISK